VRAAFVNQSQGETRRMHVPDLVGTPWDRLDFLGWRDPRAPHRAYLVTEHDGETRGIALRLTEAAARRPRSTMCALCLTVGEAALMVAPRAGKPGRNGSSVGTYVCADLACSLYVRGIRRPARAQPPETLTTEQRVARLESNLGVFLARVLRGG